jgi:predicted PurR-regulated permease PerM
MSTAPASSATARRLWLVVGGLFLGLFLYRVRDTLPPFLIAFAAAALLDPLLDRMQRRGWSRTAAAGVVFAVFLLVFAGVALVLIPAAMQQAGQFVGNVPAYYAELSKRLETLLGAHHGLLHRVGLPPTSNEIIARYQEQITGVLQRMLSGLLQYFAASVSKLAWLAIIPIATFYLLMEIDPLRARVVHLVPAHHRNRFLEMAERVGAVFSGYVRGLIIVCSGYAMVAGLVLALGFHLRYSLLVGLVAGVFYAVPYVGALATVTIAGLVAAATHPSLGYVLGVVGALLVINQVFDQIITPRVVGGLVGLNPVLSLFALTAGGELFGLPGMILAVPVAASIKVVLLSLWPQLSEPLSTEEIRASSEENTPWREDDGRLEAAAGADTARLAPCPSAALGPEAHPVSVSVHAVTAPSVPVAAAPRPDSLTPPGAQGPKQKASASATGRTKRKR